MNKKTIGIAAIAALSFIGGCLFRADSKNILDSKMLEFLAQSAACFWAGGPSSLSASCNITVNGKISSSNLGTYCGQTSSTNGNLGGYPQAKALCVTACGSSHAHMCSSHEMGMSAQLNMLPPSNSWVSTFMLARAGGGTSNVMDCVGWTSNLGSEEGNYYDTAGKFSSSAICSTLRPIACCL